jgi:cysteine sulfinate desulfinase/cysteine desulfurase-like protein
MVTLPGLPAGWLGTLAGVAASGGSACHAGQGSPVLRAMGWPPAEAANSIRIGFGVASTRTEAEACAEALAHGSAALRRAAGGP